MTISNSEEKSNRNKWKKKRRSLGGHHITYCRKVKKLLVFSSMCDNVRWHTSQVWCHTEDRYTGARALYIDSRERVITRLQKNPGLLRTRFSPVHTNLPDAYSTQNPTSWSVNRKPTRAISAHTHLHWWNTTTLTLNHRNNWTPFWYYSKTKPTTMKLIRKSSLMLRTATAKTNRALHVSYLNTEVRAMRFLLENR